MAVLRGQLTRRERELSAMRVQLEATTAEVRGVLLLHAVRMIVAFRCWLSQEHTTGVCLSVKYGVSGTCSICRWSGCVLPAFPWRVCTRLAAPATRSRSLV